MGNRQIRRGERCVVRERASWDVIGVAQRRIDREAVRADPFGDEMSFPQVAVDVVAQRWFGNQHQQPQKQSDRQQPFPRSVGSHRPLQREQEDVADEGDEEPSDGVCDNAGSQRVVRQVDPGDPGEPDHEGRNT